MTPARRAHLFDEAESRGVILSSVVIHATQINIERGRKNLDRLILEAMVSLAYKAAATDVVADAVGSMEKSQAFLSERLEGARVSMFRKADELNPLVAWASIAAKVERDQQMRNLEEQYGPLGSGYNTPQTHEFLASWSNSNDYWPDFVRTGWKTLERLPLNR